MSTNVKPVARDDVQYSALEDGAVIYDTASERVHVLNNTAAYIWNMCDGSVTLDDIRSEVKSLAGPAWDEISPRVEQILVYLEKEGLLRR